MNANLSVAATYTMHRHKVTKRTVYIYLIVTGIKQEKEGGYVP